MANVLDKVEKDKIMLEEKANITTMELEAKTRINADKTLNNKMNSLVLLYRLETSQSKGLIQGPLESIIIREEIPNSSPWTGNVEET